MRNQKCFLGLTILGLLVVMGCYDYVPYLLEENPPTPLITLKPVGVTSPTPDPTPVSTPLETKVPTPALPGFREYQLPTEDAGIFKLTLASDGSVWFIEKKVYKIGHFNPETEVFTEYELTEEPWDICIDKVRNLVYYTGGSYGNGIYGVIDPSKPSVDVFTTNLPVASSVDCCIDKQGYFWFNGWDSQSISVVNREGYLTNHTLPMFGYTSGLTEDDEGNKWLIMVGAYEYNPRLIKMDNVNQFTTYYLPQSPITTRAPSAIERRIWYILTKNNDLGSYDSWIEAFDPETEKVETFTEPTRGCGISCLVADDNGRIWFTERLANKIGSLQPDTGIMTEITLPTPASCLEDMEIDKGKGCLWYAAEAVNKLGCYVFP